MEWELLTNIDLSTSEDWAFTPETSSALFKIAHASGDTDKLSYKGRIAQAINEPIFTFDARGLYFRNTEQIFLFPLPNGISSRRLAFKKTATIDAAWTIQIEQLLGEDILSLPINISDVYNLQNELNSKSDLEHGHEISEIANLQFQLDDKISKGQPVWIPLNLTSNWSAVTSPQSTPAYRKHNNGMVEVKGSLNRNTGASDLIAVLPVGYRPIEQLSFFSIQSAAAGVRQMTIDVNGELKHVTGGSNVSPVRFYVTFFAEQ